MTGHRDEITDQLKKPIPGITEPLSPISQANAPSSLDSGQDTSKTRPGLIYEVLRIAGLAAGYYIAAKLGLKLALVYPNISSVWPGTGIALAAILILGYKVWPGIFLGAFFANMTTAGSAATSLGIAFGNTLEGVIGAYLLNRFANGRNVFNRARDILKFVILAAVLSTLLGATLGTISLALGNFIQARDLAPAWFTWWLGDTIGSILLTPLIVLWSTNRRVRWTARRVTEAALFFSSFAVVCLAVFGGLIRLSEENYPLEFLCVPFFLWTAFRFGQRETATAVAVLSAISLWGTLQEYGPFATRPVNEALLLLQSFLGVKALLSLVLAAIVSENRRVESELLHLAVTDPLTGLANYRKFIDTLEAEIKRAQRSRRSFAILFVDVNDLKSINDRLGHLAGNQALCRVANALRGSCRSIDTVARFGGDEFAVILPETNKEAARGVAERVAHRLAADRDGEPISVSVGIAVHPFDGESAESLVSAADSGLYRAKTKGRNDRRGISKLPHLPVSDA